MIKIKIAKDLYEYYNKIIGAYNFYYNSNLSIKEVIYKGIYNMLELMTQRYNKKNKIQIEIKDLSNSVLLFENIEYMMYGFKQRNYSNSIEVNIDNLPKSMEVIFNKIEYYYNLNDKYSQIINYALFYFKTHFFHYVKRASIDASLNIIHVFEYLKKLNIIDKDYIILLDTEDKKIMKCKLTQSNDANLIISINRDENTKLKNIFMSCYSSKFSSDFNIDLYKYLQEQQGKDYITIINELFDIIFFEEFSDKVEIIDYEESYLKDLYEEYDIEESDYEYVKNHRINVYRNSVGSSGDNSKTGSGSYDLYTIKDIYNDFKKYGNEIGYKNFSSKYLEEHEVYVCKDTTRPLEYNKVFYFIKNEKDELVGASIRNIDEEKDAENRFVFEYRKHKYNLYNIQTHLEDKTLSLEILKNKLIQNDSYFGYYIDEYIIQSLKNGYEYDINLFDKFRIKGQIMTTKINSRFKSSKVLYNIKNCSDKKVIYIVEGVKDALSVIKNGEQAIALLTAKKLSNDQLELFKKYINKNTEIRLGLDSDCQGTISNMKLYMQLFVEGYTNIKIIKYLKGKDFGDMDYINFNNDISLMNINEYYNKIRNISNEILKDTNEQQQRQFNNTLNILNQFIELIKKEDTKDITSVSINEGIFRIKTEWDINKVNKYLAFFLNKQNI